MRYLMIIGCLLLVFGATGQSKKEQIESLQRQLRLSAKLLVKANDLYAERGVLLENLASEMDSIQLEADLLKKRVKEQKRELTYLKKRKISDANQIDSLKARIEKLEYPRGKKQTTEPTLTFGGSANGGSGSGDGGGYGGSGVSGDGYAYRMKTLTKPDFSKIEVAENCRLTYLLKIDAKGNVIKATPVTSKITTIDASLVLRVGRILMEELTYSNPKGLNGVTKQRVVYLDKK